MTEPKPIEMRAKRQEQILVVKYADGEEFHLPFEYLRVFSPSAEVTGHGGPVLLVVGKESVGIERIEPIGNYAVRIHFDDGHNTGLYSWSYLRRLGVNFEKNWQDYRKRLQKAGYH